MTKASMKLSSVRAAGTACGSPGSVVALVNEAVGAEKAQALLFVNDGD
jgi:hypothetical protein